MAKRIAILRGINVGGKRIIRMDDLKSLFQNLGFVNIETYIQSGNVMFDVTKTNSDVEIADLLEKAIFDKYGFQVPVIIQSVEEIEKAIENNPFYRGKKEDIEKLHCTFLKEMPSTENRNNTQSCQFEPDKFMISGKHVFIYCEGKYHQTKINNGFIEKKLKTTATTRNWKTVLKLLELGKN
jgi:uncharacterized protein (DUF1697 family)